VLIIFLGLVVSGSNNENDGIEGKLIRSESEVYSDAVADFSDNGSSPGVKQILQQEGDSLDSGIDFERVNNTKEHTLLASSEYNDSNGNNMSLLQCVCLNFDGIAVTLCGCAEGFVCSFVKIAVNLHWNVRSTKLTRIQI
jgi:hypothetical protein